MTTLHRFLVTIVLLPVMFYRRVLSPMKRAPTCRYLPTCSEYAVDAVKQRGIVVGIALAIWRVLRCHPFARGGYDPVRSTRGKSKIPTHACTHHAQEQL